MKLDPAARLAGAVWGHLVGDAVGVPYEFRAPSQIGAVAFGAAGTHGQPGGTWSDDGALMLALLDSLLSSGFDPADFARRATAWHRRGLYTPDGDGYFDIGSATRSALEAIESGTSPEKAGETGEWACGNGSLMGILPLALVERDADDRVLVDHAHRLSAVTHGHPRPKTACALYVLIARRLLAGSPRAEALHEARASLRAVYESQADGAEFLAALEHLEDWGERNGRGRVWDSFWSAWDAFADAATYRETIERAVSYGNDTDTTAAIAGGLAGIRFGIDQIPFEWLAGMRGRSIVQPMVDGLIETTGRRTSTSSPLRVDWIDTFYVPLVMHAKGRLGMTFLPGKRASGQVGDQWRDLHADVHRLRDDHGVDVFVNLAEDAELERLGISRLSDALASRQIDLLRYPIRDGAVPADRDAFRSLLDDLLGRLLTGGSVVVAYRGGLGRTGLLVACLIRDLGNYDGEDAIELTRSYRHGTVETEARRAFVAKWHWPRRQSVEQALRIRGKQNDEEDAALFASMPAEDATFERLRRGLRDVLRDEPLTAAYLVQPTLRRPAPIVCYLVDAVDPIRVANLVRASASRLMNPANLAVLTGPVDQVDSVLVRVMPVPPDRLGA